MYSYSVTYLFIHSFIQGSLSIYVLYQPRPAHMFCWIVIWSLYSFCLLISYIFYYSFILSCMKLFSHFFWSIYLFKCPLVVRCFSQDLHMYSTVAFIPHPPFLILFPPFVCCHCFFMLLLILLMLCLYMGMCVYMIDQSISLSLCLSLSLSLCLCLSLSLSPSLCLSLSLSLSLSVSVCLSLSLSLLSLSLSLFSLLLFFPFRQ